jgi:hypothetical protein
VLEQAEVALGQGARRVGVGHGGCDSTGRRKSSFRPAAGRLVDM